MTALVKPEDLLQFHLGYAASDDAIFKESKKRHSRSDVTMLVNSGIEDFFTQNVQSLAAKNSADIRFSASRAGSAIEGIVKKDGALSMAHIMVKGWFSENKQELLLVHSDPYRMGEDVIFQRPKFGVATSYNGLQERYIQFAAANHNRKLRLLDHLIHLQEWASSKSSNLTFDVL